MDKYAKMRRLANLAADKDLSFVDLRWLASQIRAEADRREVLDDQPLPEGERGGNAEEGS